MKHLTLISLILIAFSSKSQRIETAINFSNKKGNFVFEVENDMLFSTDSYYTAGAGFSYTNVNIKKTPAQLFFKPKNKDVLTYTGFGFQQRIFTPYSITQPELIENDQPYSAYLLLSNYSVIINPIKRIRISNELGIGYMGKEALGYEVQSLVHKVVGSPEPLGWDKQLNNIYIIDYQVRIEKGFGSDWFASHFSPFMAARIGTLTDRLQVGYSIRFGNRTKYLTAEADPKGKFIWEWVFSSNFQGVFYDASLQGNLFESSPNSLNSEQVISRQYQFRTGFNLNYNRISFRYMLNFNSSNFNEATFHRFGSLNIGFSF